MGRFVWVLPSTTPVLRPSPSEGSGVGPLSKVLDTLFSSVSFYKTPSVVGIRFHFPSTWGLSKASTCPLLCARRLGPRLRCRGTVFTPPIPWSVGVPGQKDCLPDGWVSRSGPGTGVVFEDYGKISREWILPYCSKRYSSSPFPNYRYSWMTQATTL